MYAYPGTLAGLESSGDGRAGVCSLESGRLRQLVIIGEIGMETGDNMNSIGEQRFQRFPPLLRQLSPGRRNTDDAVGWAQFHPLLHRGHNRNIRGDLRNHP